MGEGPPFPSLPQLTIGRDSTYFSLRTTDSFYLHKMADPAFANAGKAPGLTVWRVESFKLVQVASVGLEELWKSPRGRPENIGTNRAILGRFPYVYRFMPQIAYISLFHAGPHRPVLHRCAHFKNSKRLKPCSPFLSPRVPIPPYTLFLQENSGAEYGAKGRVLTLEHSPNFPMQATATWCSPVAREARESIRNGLTRSISGSAGTNPPPPPFPSCSLPHPTTYLPPTTFPSPPFAAPISSTTSTSGSALRAAPMKPAPAPSWPCSSTIPWAEPLCSTERSRATSHPSSSPSSRE
jgi:hypothetical protein